MVMLPTSFTITLVLVYSAWSANASPSRLRLAHTHRNVSASRVRYAYAKRDPSPVEQEAGAPTPAPTGSSSSSTTVHITDDGDFALLLPNSPGGVISDAEGNAVSFCYGSEGCDNTMPNGFITGAHVSNGSSGSLRWTQVTGCIDPSKYQLSTSDEGGQFDVRFPEGAQCSFGGFGASFIEQVEPSASRFCLRCCSNPDDQTNCNSHHDKEGCLVSIPGVYSFENGVSCDG